MTHHKGWLPMVTVYNPGAHATAFRLSLSCRWAHIVTLPDVLNVWGDFHLSQYVPWINAFISYCQKFCYTYNVFVIDKLFKLASFIDQNVRNLM